MNFDWAKYTKLLSVFICVAVASFFAGRFTKQPEIKTVTETVIQEKIVERNVQISDKSKRTVTVKKPDGTVIQSVTEKNITASDNQKQTETKIEQKQEVVLNPTKLPSYSLGIQAKHPLSLPLKKPEYTLSVGYRVIGPIWAEGLYGINPQSVGIGIRLEK
jgi:preprotein translocase subunit SecF